MFTGKQCPRNKKHRSMPCIRTVSHHCRPLLGQLQKKSIFSLRYHIFMPLPSAFCKGNTHAKSLQQRKSSTPSCPCWAHDQAVVTCPGKGSSRLQHTCWHKVITHTCSFSNAHLKHIIWSCQNSFWPDPLTEPAPQNQDKWPQHRPCRETWLC